MQIYRLWVIYEGNSGLCPNCGKHSGFNHTYRAQIWPSYESMMRGGFVATEGSSQLPRPATRAEVRVLQCLHCRETVAVLDKINPSKMVREVIYPEMPPRQLDEAVPEKVRSVFAEASRCEQLGAMRAAGVLYRATVEAMAEELGATGRNLYEQIESLNGRLPEEVVTSLHEARLLGNDSIHDLLEYAADEVEDVAELIEEAALHVYVQPQQRAAMRERRRARREGQQPS